MKTIQKTLFLIGILLAANTQAGRWISRDPIEFMERDPKPQVNLYNYVGNNPINAIDPLGLQDVYLGWLKPNQIYPDNFVGPLPFGSYHNSEAMALADHRGLQSDPVMEALMPGGGVLWQLEAKSSFCVAKAGIGAADDATKWIWGQNKGVAKSIRQMEQRGWNPQEVTEAIKGGEQFPAQNFVNPGNPAIRYINPKTGQSVIQDTVTKEIIHFGGPGFKY